MDDPQPLGSIDDWEDDLLRRYPEPGDDKQQDDFRDYGNTAPDHVREFYRLNHRHQTVEFGYQKRDQYLPLSRARMSAWEALEFLDTLVDQSDPDTELSQIQHCLQTAEAIRADGHPRWFILVGLVHDLGKILCLWDEPQWAVTGDTYPVGCAFSEKIVFPEFFRDNPDSDNPDYQSETGIYEPGIGLENVTMSWGHDEYTYQVMRDYLPREGLAMIRYHSFYPWHHDGAYQQLMNDDDREMLLWVQKFQSYDLYSKSDSPPDVELLKPFYSELIDEFFPPVLAW